MKPLSILFFFFLVHLSFISYSQEKIEEQYETSSRWQLLKHDGISVFGGVKHSFTQPLKWKRKDWTTLGGIAAGTTLLYFFVDDPANGFFTDQKEDIPKVIRQVGFRFGKPLVSYGITTSVYALGLLIKNEKVRKTGVLLIASATAGGLIQSFSKTVVGRARPDSDGNGRDIFKFFNKEARYHSFPSGHSVLSFTTAYAVAKQFKNPFIKGGFYAVGLISPISRLWEGAHWLTDVSLGIVLSVVIVDGIDNYLNTNKRYAYNNKRFKIEWDLNIGPGQLGVIGKF